MNSGIRILMCDPNRAGAWRQWTDPVEVLETRDATRVLAVLKQVEKGVHAGLHAVGFVGYEAGSAFDPAFISLPADTSYPLAWFGLFSSSEACPIPTGAKMPSINWHAAISKAKYRSRINAIKRCIAAGETYQVNFTFPLHATGDIDTYNLFCALYAQQPSPYAMYIETPLFQIASVSPERFFTLKGNQIVCDPMKGTCPRGLHPALDEIAGATLQQSEKNRAENVMIVDMVRNDLSRIADPGSVKTRSLFDVTRWPTLWQMTSTVTAETSADMTDIFTALFPSASITGAPKIKTSEIISQIESTPRGIYTGAIGWWFPGRNAQFAVAIRTAIQVRAAKKYTYGIGSGIVWESDADDEYRECLLKSRVLKSRADAFRLVETLRWSPDEGYLFPDEHLLRMKLSAEYFGFRFSEPAIRARLTRLSRRFGAVSRRVRLLSSKSGRITIEHTELTSPGHYTHPETAPVITACVDDHRIPLESPFLYHKTTRRNLYEQARRRHPDLDEVLLVNHQNAVMEFTTGNLVIRKGSQWLTPAIESGLLPGVFRDILIKQDRITAARVSVEDVRDADETYFINSVRGWRRVSFVSNTSGGMRSCAS